MEQDLAIKRNELDTHNSWIDLQRTTLNFKEPGPQSCVLYDSMYTKFVEYNSYKGEEQTRGYQQLKRDWEQDGRGCDCKRETDRIVVVTGTLCILSVWMSASWLTYCTRVDLLYKTLTIW